MGVHGWHRYLIDHCWLPSSNFDNEETSPWLFYQDDDDENDENDSLDEEDPYEALQEEQPQFARRLETIPSNSVLLIDGYGLVFYLQKVAYARHFENVWNETDSASNKKNNKRRNNKKNKLRKDQVNRLLPSFLPMALVHKVVQEYIDVLQNLGILVKVYWDGPQRFKVKQTTDSRRQEEFSRQWENYQLYCQQGALPTNTNSNTSTKANPMSPQSLLENLPMSKLVIAQVQHSLRVSGVPMETCVEEADRILAKLGQNHSNVYVVGSDSDFCFFPDLQYIPLTTMGILLEDTKLYSHGRLMACVITRSKLAKDIGFSNESLMVELAILCGNDYLVEPWRANLNCPASKPLQNIEQLKAKQQDNVSKLDSSTTNGNTQGTYEITSPSKDITQILTFIRALYSHDELTLATFPITKHGSTQRQQQPDLPNQASETTTLQHDSRPRVPSACLDPAGQQRRQGGGGSISKLQLNAIVKECFASYKMTQQHEQQGTKVNIMQQHLDAFLNTPNWDNLPPQATKEISTTHWRPQWEDVYAAYFIEKIIAKVVQVDPKNVAPFKVFDSMYYQYQLWKMNNKAPTTPTSPFETPTKTAAASTFTTQNLVSTDGFVSTQPTMTPSPIQPLPEFLKPSQVSWSTARPTNAKFVVGPITAVNRPTGRIPKLPSAKGCNGSYEDADDDVINDDWNIKDASKHQLSHHTQRKTPTTNSEDQGKTLITLIPDISHLFWLNLIYLALARKDGTRTFCGHEVGDLPCDPPRMQLQQPVNDMPLVSKDKPTSKTTTNAFLRPSQLGWSIKRHTNGACEVNKTTTPQYPKSRPKNVTSILAPTIEFAPSSELMKPYEQPWAYGSSQRQEIVDTTTPCSPASDYVEARVDLPIDEHEARILNAVRRNRVTIIQAETGAGKSTRVPCMLLRANLANINPHHESRLFISQPRRIAAKALVLRLRKSEPDLRDCFTLRLGHGVREFESKKSRAWFVTTGYLVRLLANHPEQFAQIDYVIIDEVHERSVDTDLLCFLCRRLLQRNDKIRLILMSATLASEMYREYFNTREAAIFVGARRFPVREVYLDDLPSEFNLPARLNESVHQMIDLYTKMKCRMTPNPNHTEIMYSIVTQVAAYVAQPGTSVLVFVSGMTDIVALFDSFEELCVPGIRYTCLPVHSDIPFEEQMEVFRQCDEDEVKIILATNAAESSLTLPDVDNVICLGLCKRIEYNELSHRQLLMATWISRSSATQRAGRTGRVRPGTVYRLYTRENYERDMAPFEPGEIVRTPLDSVILTLKTILGEEDDVTSTLLDCIEPPRVATIDRSFESLYKSDFITKPSDNSEITNLGNFVSQLGIDLTLGSLIGLGIQFGVSAEAVQLAGVLTFPRSPWVMSNPMYHEPEDFNRMTKESFVSQCKFDGGLMSEPFAIMNMLYDYDRKDGARLKKFISKNCLHSARVRRLATTCNNLRKRVSVFLGIPGSDLEVKVPPKDMSHNKLTILRVIQAWVFHDTIIRCESTKLKGVEEGGVLVQLKATSDTIEEHDLEQFLDTDNHLCEIRGYQEIKQTGFIDVDVDPELLKKSSDLSAVERKLLSYASEKDFGLVWIVDDNLSSIYFKSDIFGNPGSAHLVETYLTVFAVSTIFAEPVTSARRGVGARPCGLWNVRVLAEDDSNDPSNGKTFLRFQVDASIDPIAQLVGNALHEYTKTHLSIRACFCQLAPNRRNRRKFTCQLLNCPDKITQRDLLDLFSVASITKQKTTSIKGNQTLFFPFATDPKRLSGDCSNTRYAPEGYRLVSVLAAKRSTSRARAGICLPAMLDPEEEADSNGNYEDGRALFPEIGNHAKKWRRMGKDQQVVINADCIQATVCPVDGNPTIFACAANCLELKKSGSIRAEGLTMFSQGPLFVLLCLVSFGLMGNDDEFEDEEEIVTKSINFIRRHSEPNKKIMSGVEGDWQRRIRQAIDFHDSCKYQGEELRCFPDKIKALQAIFDGIEN